MYIVIIVAVIAVAAYYFSRPASLLGGLHKYSPDKPDSYTVVTDLTYGEGKQNNFDLYLPNNKQDVPYPLVVWIHGGGFVAGDKKDNAFAKDAATRGFVSASINYTTNTKDHPTDLDTMYAEVKASVEAVVQQAEDRGYHVNQMAITGDSAGGTLAMMYAFRDGADAPVPLKFVFQEVGPASFHPEDWIRENGKIRGYGHDKKKFVADLTATEITDQNMADGTYQEIARRVSPYHYVSDSSVPLLMAYGKKDKAVPFKAHERLLQALEKHQVHYDYFVFPNSGHRLNSDPEVAKKYVEKLGDYYGTYFTL